MKKNGNDLDCRRNFYLETFCLRRTVRAKSAPVEQFTLSMCNIAWQSVKGKVLWSPHPKRSGDACTPDARSPGFVIAVSLAPKVTVSLVPLSHRSVR